MNRAAPASRRTAAEQRGSMTQNQQLGAILEAIGGLKANVEGLRRDLGDLKDEADESEERSRESRARLYERVDELAVTTTRVEGDAKLAVATSAQARDGVGHLANQVTKHADGVTELATQVAKHADKLDAHIKVVTPVI